MPNIVYEGKQGDVLMYGRGGSRLVRFKDGTKKWVPPDYENMRRGSSKKKGNNLITPPMPNIS